MASSHRSSFKTRREDLFIDVDAIAKPTQELEQGLIIKARDEVSDSFHSEDINIKPSKLMLSPNADLNRRMGEGKTFVERTFSKLDRGSVRGSIFSLSASAIGSGVLSLPYVLKLCGYAQGLAFMILGAAGALVSLRMLASVAVEQDLPNFSKIALKAGGDGLNLLLSVMIMVFMFGSCISYQIIVTSLAKYVAI